MKKITREQYYHALALFMLAIRKQKEVNQMEDEMNDILKQESGSHFSDALYDTAYSGKIPEKEFKAAMQKAKIEIIKDNIKNKTAS